MSEELEQNAEQAPEQEPTTPAPNERFKWYILHAYSGFERKVRESIQSRVQAFGLSDRVGRVMIPTEPVTEIVCGVVVELLETLPPTEDTAAVPLTVLLKARVAP